MYHEYFVKYKYKNLVMSLFSKPTTYILRTFVFVQSTNIFSNTKMVMKVTTLITKLSTYFFI